MLCESVLQTGLCLCLSDTSQSTLTTAPESQVLVQQGKQGSRWAEFSEELPPVPSAKLRRPAKTRRAVLCLSRDGREDLIGVFYLLISSIQVPQA